MKDVPFFVLLMFRIALLCYAAAIVLLILAAVGVNVPGP